MWIASAILLVLLGGQDAALAAVQGVRVVDAVNVTDAREEASHGLDGEGMTVGEAAGRKWRSATGWFSYTLRIYDDTALTIVCRFADGGKDRAAFDVLVDGQKAAAQPHKPQRSNPQESRFTLPLAATAGRTEVTVTFRAHPDSRTARLLEVRSVQEHLE